MPNLILHRRIRILTLAAGETIAEHCETDDIALLEDAQGWWVHFVGDNGSSETYDQAFGNHQEALWAAKAAAEFSSSL